MGIPLRGRLLSCQATLTQVLDRDSNSPRLHVSRWTKKKEKNSRKLFKGVENSEGDIFTSTSSFDRCSKTDRRPRTAVKRLPQSILKLVRFLVKKAIPPRTKARMSGTRKGKQRSLATARAEFISKDAASTAEPQATTVAAAVLTAAAAAAAVVGERGAHETATWIKWFSRSAELRLLAPPVHVQQLNEQADTRLWNRLAASSASILTAVTTRPSASASRTEITNTRKCYRSSSRWWQIGTWEVIERRRRSTVKDTRSIIAEKLHLLLKGCSPVSLFSHCICKRAFEPASRERKALKNKVSSSQAVTNEDEEQKKGKDKKGKDEDGVNADELTSQASEKQFKFCCYRIFQYSEDQGVSVESATRSLFPISSFPLSASSAEGSPLSILDGSWEMVSSFLYAGGSILNQINSVRSEENESHPFALQDVPPSLPFAAHTKVPAERQIPATAEQSPLWPCGRKSWYSTSAYTEKRREIQKTNSLQGSNFCYEKMSCTLQCTRMRPDALKEADTLCMSDSCLDERVGIREGSSNIEDACYKGSWSQQETALLQMDSDSLGYSNAPLLQPCPCVRESTAVQNAEVPSACFSVQQEGSRLKYSAVDTCGCGNCRFQQHTCSSDGALERHTGSTEESITLLKTSSSRAPALVRASRSRRTWVKEHPLLRPRRCVIWERYCSPRGNAEFSTPCFRSERMQQPPLHPRRPILVEKNKILLEDLQSGLESPLFHQPQRERTRSVFCMWKHLFTKKKNKKRRVRLRFESLECIAYYSMHQPPAANAFYRYTRLSTQVYFGDKALRPPLQPRKKAAKELKSGMTAEEAIQWSLSSKNARNKFTQCNAT